MQNSKVNKNAHAGKSASDKNEYKKILNNPLIKIDDTYKDKKNYFKNYSTEANNLGDVENKEEDKTLKKRNIPAFDKITIVKDKVLQNPLMWLLGTIVTIILGALFSNSYSLNREFGEMKTSFKNMEEDIVSFKNNETSYPVFQAEFKKDIEFIKYRLEVVENKI